MHPAVRLIYHKGAGEEDKTSSRVRFANEKGPATIAGPPNTPRSGCFHLCCRLVD
jgi:hypothetical protein